MEKKRRSKALVFLLSFAVIASCFTALGSGTKAYGATPKNAQYSLAGAEYQLYLDQACTQPAKDKDGNNALLVTKEDGTVDMMEIETGNYHAKETKASKGYLLDSKVYPVTVTRDNTPQSPATFSSTEMPTVGRMITLRKYDKNGEDGWRKLLDAEYTLKYYDVDPSTTDVSGKTPVRTWKFKTVKKFNSEGRPCAGIDFTYDAPLAGSDEFYEPKVLAYQANGRDLDFNDDEFDKKFHHYKITSNGVKTRVMPIGVYTIEETKAPDGLTKDPTVYYGSVSQPSNGADAITEIRGTPGFEINVLTGKVEHEEDKQKVEINVDKYVGQTGEKEPLGKATTLAGAEYNVYYDDPALGQAELVGKITTDEEGKGKLTKRQMGTQAMIGQDLRPGTYFVEEVSAPDGFLIDKYVLADDGSTKEFTGELEAICDYTEDGTPVKKTVKDTYEDGRHKFIARVQATGVSTFEYTLKSNDYETETHIKKTDATTKEELPGARLQVFSLNEGSMGELVEEWTSTKEEHIIYGLTSGKYLLREITSPYGYDIAEDIEFEVEENKIVTKVEMQNTPVTVGTIATDKSSGTHHGIKSDGVVLTDTVKVTGLHEGRKYKVTGILMDKSTGEPFKDADDKEVTAETDEFTATGEEMEVELEFTFDASKFDNNVTLVAFERISRTSTVPVKPGHPERADEELPIDLGGHEDIDDEEQTIPFGGIASTVAVDTESKSHNVLAAGSMSVTDTVKYENLVVGQKYQLDGEWYDKTDGKLTGEKASKTFTPTESDGLVDVVFDFDTSKYEGHSLVCFEKLSVIPQDKEGKDKDPVEVSSHEDPDDEDQTIHIPEVRTTAEAIDTKEHITMARQDIVIKDVVKYKNLIPGKTYTANGKLVYKDSGNDVIDDGKTVTATAEFTPKDYNGEVVLEFKFNGVALAGKTVVAFEEVYEEKYLVGVHADLEDEDQSVHIPKIGTTAIDSNTKDHVASSNKTVTVIDTVKYENLIPGKEYTMKGKPMLKSTGEVLKDAAGNDISAELKFTPDKADGEVELTFNVPASALKGDTIVAFEDLYYNDVLIATHTDLTDEDQSVHIPEVKTTALDSDTKDHISNGDDSITIVDHVIYKNLVVGKKYTAKGKLMDATTGKPVKVDGEIVTAEAEFTPKTSDGEVVLKFRFDGTGLHGKKIVVFEDVYFNNVLVASHADLTDKNQSVVIPKIGTKAGKLHGKYVTDTVAYKNLIPGRTYICKGWFVDKKTGNKVLGSGGELEFTAKKANGYIEVNLVPGSHKGSMVAFEEMYIVNEDTGKKALVGEHKDINDPDQVYTPAPSTGDDHRLFLLGGAFVVAVALAVVLFIRKRKLQGI